MVDCVSRTFENLLEFPVCVRKKTVNTESNDKKDPTVNFEHLQIEYPIKAGTSPIYCFKSKVGAPFVWTFTEEQGVYNITMDANHYFNE